jgi:peroxiredoxin
VTGSGGRTVTGLPALTAVADNSDMAEEQEMTEPSDPSIETGPAAEAVAAAAEAVVAAKVAEVADATEAEAEPKPRARDLNELIRYTMWSVFRVSDRARLESGGLGNAAAEVDDLLEQAAGKGVVTRGCYDLQGLRAGADYMFWWVAPDPDDLQDLYTGFRRMRLGRCSEPVWSVMALHRPAEFNKSHIPAFVAEEEPRAYVSVYPFVRSYQWYLLDPADRRRMLAEHGMMAREYPDVRANTVPCFALNDYEWILAFEADELHRLVDLMRHLRGSEARLHTRVEIPFYAGRRKPVRELVAALA